MSRSCFCNSLLQESPFLGTSNMMQIHIQTKHVATAIEVVSKGILEHKEGKYKIT